MKKWKINIMFISLIFVFVFVGCANSINPKSVSASKNNITKSKPVNNLPVKVYGIAIGEEINMKNVTGSISSYLEKRKGYMTYSGYIFPKNINDIKGLGSITYSVVPSSKKVARFRFDTPYRKDLDNFQDCRVLKNNLLENFYNKYGGVLSNQIDAKYTIVDDQVYVSSKGKLVINNIIIKSNCLDLVNRKTNKHMAMGGVDIIIPTLVNQYKQEKTTINNNSKKNISEQAYSEMLK